MSVDRDLQGLVRSWLHEDRHEDATRVIHTVLDGSAAAPQHRPLWSVGGTYAMNKFLAIGLAAAALVAVIVIGSQLWGTRLPGGPGPTQSVEPSASALGELPVGPHVIDPGRTHGEDRVAVMIPGPGWFAPDSGSVSKDLGGGSQVTVVVLPGDHYTLPPNTCNWQIGDADLRENYWAESADEFVAYVARQPYDPDGMLTRDFSTPEDITIEGTRGLRIVNTVREYSRADPNVCDEHRFCTVQDRDQWGCLLSHPEPGALDTLWVVGNLAGRPWFLVVASSGSPDAELRAEMNTLVESMTLYSD